MRKAEGLFDLMMFMDEQKIALLTSYLKKDTSNLAKADLITKLKLNRYITYN